MTTLYQLLIINRSLGFSDKEFFKSRMSHSVGRGNKAKSRASSIIDLMIKSGSFSKDFDRINRFSM